MNRVLRKTAWIGLMLLISTKVVFADEWVVRDASIMGTTIHAEVWHEDKSLAEQVAQEVMRVMEHVNKVMSPYRKESELARVNREAAVQPVQVSAHLFEVISESLRYSDLTEGAFDITFARC